jgi:hypothetical protein
MTDKQEMKDLLIQGLIELALRYQEEERKAELDQSHWETYAKAMKIPIEKLWKDKTRNYKSAVVRFHEMRIEELEWRIAKELDQSWASVSLHVWRALRIPDSVWREYKEPGPWGLGECDNEPRKGWDGEIA